MSARSFRKPRPRSQPGHALPFRPRAVSGNPLRPPDRREGAEGWFFEWEAIRCR